MKAKGGDFGIGMFGEPLPFGKPKFTIEAKTKEEEFNLSKKEWIDSIIHTPEFLKQWKIAHLCNKCKIKDMRILLVHHRDRNRFNNNIENLEILCRNCHFLEHLDEWRESRK